MTDVSSTTELTCKACGFASECMPGDVIACPQCGETDRLAKKHVMTIDETVAVHESLTMRAKGEDGKVNFEAKQGDSFFRKTGEWHEVVQVVDKAKDQYRKKVVDKATRKVIKDVSEPLSEHVADADKRRREQAKRRADSQGSASAPMEPNVRDTDGDDA